MDTYRESSEKEASEESQEIKSAKSVHEEDADQPENLSDKNQDNVTIQNSSPYIRGNVGMTYRIPNSTLEPLRDTDNEILDDSWDTVTLLKGMHSNVM